ncbi:MAG: methionine--tRNA ligase [Candidatus Cloacimonadaceae bacterium]
MKYLVTSALPYANGKLHIGHVAGAYLPADIFVRFLRLHKEDVIYICGTDEHGTPISIQADAEGVEPKVIVDRYHALIKEAFDGIDIEFDNFSGTSRPPHFKISQEFFLSLYKRGDVHPKDTLQFYCEHDKRFLADRYVEGICPNCDTPGARGDQCDACGQIYDTTTLKEPKCKICGNTPVIKGTRHWFLHLDGFTQQMKDWLAKKEYWKENVRNFMLNLLEQGLVERSITRDIKWGIPVPLEEAKDKVLYVWFEAPIGYISSTLEWAEKIGQPERWKDYWLDPETKLIHFIGKDNIIFHALIWPAVLMGQEKTFALPHDIPANEFMNLEGQKISTSRNWAIWVDEFVKEFDGDYLRYYLANNAPESKDSDFSWKDFQNKVNNELNNTLGNLAHRVFAFSKKQFGGIVKPVELSDAGKSVLSEAKDLCKQIEQGYKEYQVRRNTKLIMDIARLGNKFFDESKPWQSVKDNRNAAEETIYICTCLLRMISAVLYPIIPKSMLKLRAMLGLKEISHWDECQESYQDTLTLTETAQLFTKIEDEVIEKQLEKLYKAGQDNGKSALEESKIPPLKPEISYDDFAKMDIRIAKVLEAEAVPNTDKLVKLKIDLGDSQRELVAGVALSYKPEELIGKSIVILANLQPRKIRGIVSNGMILCAHNEDKLSILLPERETPPGSDIS